MVIASAVFLIILFLLDIVSYYSSNKIFCTKGLMDSVPGAANMYYRIVKEIGFSMSALMSSFA